MDSAGLPSVYSYTGLTGKGYYIFVDDFDDDEYLNELFLSTHGTLFFTLDNNDDRSFLLEDENGFSNDLFYAYFVVWGVSLCYFYSSP